MMQIPQDRDQVQRALVVDDDQTIRLLARETLEQAGFVVEEAADGHQAMEVIERDMPDLVLLDVVMPGMDGYAVCSRIRQQTHDYNTFILMMTGLDDVDSIHQAYDAGATDFITKPINWTLLRHRADFLMKAKRADDQIRYLAMYDALTGLPNRSLLQDRLEQAIGLSTRFGQQFAVFFIDLDLFKDVNDSLGHATGDALLKSVAQRLSTTTRSNDTFARLGGDEFILLVQNLQSYANIDIVAHQVLKHFSEAFHVLQHEIQLTATLGVAVYPTDGTTAGDLLQHADTAMNYAKRQGKNCYRFFSVEMQTNVMNRLELHNELRKAIESRVLVLFYQPRVDAVSGRIIGTEALVRWEHPEKGLIPPDGFIPLAEETGLIVPLGEWVLHEACRQAMEWQHKGYAPLKMSVNLSPLQFRRSNVLAAIRRSLEETGLSALSLEIEITENTLMQTEMSAMAGQSGRSGFKPLGDQFQNNKVGQTVSDALNSLRSMGVSIALDDFGTGYSSLSYLNHFPIDVLKIDRSFIGRIDEVKGSPIITAIIAMADKLGLRVVAEGVETDIQRKELIARGCHELQGYLLGRPMNSEEIEKVLPR